MIEAETETESETERQPSCSRQMCNHTPGSSLPFEPTEPE